jgi:hypothetical protein
MLAILLLHAVFRLGQFLPFTRPRQSGMSRVFKRLSTRDYSCIQGAPVTRRSRINITIRSSCSHTSQFCYTRENLVALQAAGSVLPAVEHFNFAATDMFTRSGMIAKSIAHHATTRCNVMRPIAGG